MGKARRYGHSSTAAPCTARPKGNSYAIPTKDARLRTLPLPVVACAVDRFLAFARSRPDLQFQLTPIGCGLAGFTRQQIEPLFAVIPANVIYPPEWAR